MTALYADENVARHLVQALASLGHDVLTAKVDGRANQNVPDADVLARATALGRTVLTNNRWDYVRLHRQTSAHAGIIVYTEDPDYPALASRVHAALAPLPSPANQLVRVYRPARPPVP